MALGMLGGWGAGTLLALPGLGASLQGVAETALARAFDIAVLGLPAPSGAAPPRASRASSRAALTPPRPDAP